MQIKVFEKLLKTRNDSQTRSILNTKGHNSLPKLMTREPKSNFKDQDGSEEERHIFNIKRFSSGENQKFTEIIKRFIPSDKQSVFNATQNKTRLE